MAYADGFVIPRLRRGIDASRALVTPDADDDETGSSALLTLAEQAMAGFVRLLETDLRIQVRFIADPAQPEPAPPAGHKPAGPGIGAPVRLADGHILGMLCFFHPEPGGQLDDRDVRRLEMAARLAARLIDGADAHGIPS